MGHVFDSSELSATSIGSGLHVANPQWTSESSALPAGYQLTSFDLDRSRFNPESRVELLKQAIAAGGVFDLGDHNVRVSQTPTGFEIVEERKDQTARRAYVFDPEGNFDPMGSAEIRVMQVDGEADYDVIGETTELLADQVLWQCNSALPIISSLLDGRNWQLWQDSSKRQYLLRQIDNGEFLLEVFSRSHLKINIPGAARLLDGEIPGLARVLEFRFDCHGRVASTKRYRMLVVNFQVEGLEQHAIGRLREAIEDRVPYRSLTAARINDLRGSPSKQLGLQLLRRLQDEDTYPQCWAA